MRRKIERENDMFATHPVVEKIGKMNWTGNVIPTNWFRNITFANGKPHFVAITILAEIVYWYRPSIVRDDNTGQIVEKKKFKDDMLQRSYQSFADQFGFSKRQAKEAIDYLVQRQLIRREFRNVRSFTGTILNNVMFVEPIPENLKNVTYEEKEMELFMELLEPFGTRKRKRNPAEGWLVAVGVSVNGMRVPGDNIAIETAHQYNTSVSPVVSVGYMLPVGRHFNRYFFYPKVSVYRYENTGASTVGNFIYQTRYQSNLAFSGILQGGFYLLNMQSFKAFIAAGAGMMKLYNHKEVSTTLHVSDNTINNQYETPISKVTYQFSLTAGCNIRQSVFTMASFNAPAPVADFVYYYPQHYSFQFGLGYRF